MSTVEVAPEPVLSAATVAPRAPQRHRFNAEEYQRLGEHGVLPPESRVELIEGEIIEMAPIGLKHARSVGRLHNRFAERYGSRVYVQSQNPVHLSGDGEPQPDVALLLPPGERYDERLPEAADVLLLVEVSDTTLAYDQNTKLPLYARAGIPEVWIVNISKNWLEVYREPEGGEYLSRTTHRRGEVVAPLAFPDEAVAWF